MRTLRKPLTLAKRESKLGIAKPMHSRRCERGVLASMLLQPDACDEVLAMGVTREHFYGTEERVAFQAITQLHDAMEPIDAILLEREIIEMGLEAQCPMRIIMELFDTLPTAANAAHYASRLKELYVRRQQEADVTEGLQQLRDGQTREALALFQRATETRADGEALASRPEQMDLLRASFEDEAARGIVGIATSFPKLDQAIGGLVRGRLYIVAGRTGEGKSALTMQMALHAANNGNSVYVFSKEMTHQDMNRRSVAQLASVSLPPGAMHWLPDEQRAKVYSAVERLGQLPMTVDDRPLDLAQTVAQARRLRGQCDLMVIDHARLMEVAGDLDERESITKVTGASKRLALECNVAMILVSQINRGGAASGKPSLHTLHGSGSLEQDADGVIFICRNGYGKPGNTDPRASLVVPKNRHGVPSFIPIVWDGALTRFEESDEAGGGYDDE